MRGAPRRGASFLSPSRPQLTSTFSLPHPDQPDRCTEKFYPFLCPAQYHGVMAISGKRDARIRGRAVLLTLDGWLWA